MAINNELPCDCQRATANASRSPQAAPRPDRPVAATAPAAKPPTPVQEQPPPTPEQPTHLLRLAEALRRRRRFNEALLLIKGFDKRFPRHAEIPAVYLFAAQVLSENLHQDAGAQQLLNALLACYPDHPTNVEARQLLTVIERTQAQNLAKR